MCGDQINLVHQSKYHGCWCPGSLHHQDISTHDLDYVEKVSSCLTCGRISTTCVMSMWRIDIKWEFKYLFPLKNLAFKGLSHGSSCFQIVVTFSELFRAGLSRLHNMIAQQPLEDVLTILEGRPRVRFCGSKLVTTQLVCQAVKLQQENTHPAHYILQPF